MFQQEVRIIAAVFIPYLLMPMEALFRHHQKPSPKAPVLVPCRHQLAVVIHSMVGIHQQVVVQRFRLQLQSMGM